MAEIIYRQMPAPRELSQQIPTPQAKARMQKPQGGGKFLVQILGGARGGWLWMKLIPALQVSFGFVNIEVASMVQISIPLFLPKIPL